MDVISWYFAYNMILYITVWILDCRNVKSFFQVSCSFCPSRRAFNPFCVKGCCCRHCWWVNGTLSGKYHSGGGNKLADTMPHPLRSSPCPVLPAGCPSLFLGRFTVLRLLGCMSAYYHIGRIGSLFPVPSLVLFESPISIA